MDPAACKVIYIDDRFNAEKWISRDGVPSTPQRAMSQTEFTELPSDLQANVNAFLSVFNQVFVCKSGRSFSTKLSELHEQVKLDCTPIIACFDVGAESKHDHFSRSRPRFFPASDSPLPSPNMLRRELTFSSESDESYGLQLLSRIASDLQVEEGIKLIIPVAVVQPKRTDSHDHGVDHLMPSTSPKLPHKLETQPGPLDESHDIIDPQMMLQCLDAGSLDVVRSPLDKAGIMGLTVHAYRIYKQAKAEQSSFMSMSKSARGRKQSWVGVQEEKPYAYLREAMVKKLLKGICEPQDLIEDYQHRDLYVDEERKRVIAEAVGKWDYCGQDFTEDELVYAGYFILEHALTMPEVSKWQMSRTELLHFMQGCRVAYNSFVLYHNFKHAVDVLQSTFYFLIQIGLLPPYPPNSKAPPYANQKSPVAKLLGPFEALTLLISAIGHDVGHPGVNNMFLVKLNAPLAQLYNDQSVLEAFHCAAYSQILRRHWPTAFHDKAMRKLMISSILATDMGCHSDYMQQMGNLQEKIYESGSTDGWAPKDVDAYRILTCGLLIKCADISNVARPWSVAEKWTYKLQEEFANQGEMETAVGMETTLFGGPPELGNMLKLANGQIGFMTIFAHPLFNNVSDLIPAMRFAADEILTNKGVWFTRAEQEKRIQVLTKSGRKEGGVSPRTQSPAPGARRAIGENGANALPSSPLRTTFDLDRDAPFSRMVNKDGTRGSKSTSRGSSLAAVAAIAGPVEANQIIRSTASGSDTKKLSNSDPSIAPINNSSSAQYTSNEGQKAKAYGASALSQEAHDHSADLKDTRRDNAVSMRAGSESLPVEDSFSPQNNREQELQKFSFATSDSNEPVRTYDPQQNYQPTPATARASEPPLNLDHQLRKLEMSNDTQPPVSSQSDNTTMGTSLRGGGDESNPTPSHSTEATSCNTDKSEEKLPTDQLANHSGQRNRSISAPQQALPLLKPTYSLASDQGETSGGSKSDIRTMIHSNGDVGEEKKDGDRKQNTKMIGRRRSRLKLNFAFWKKRGTDKNVGEDDKVDDKVEAIPSRETT